MSKVDLQEVLNAFNIENKIVPYGNGHINDTYCSDPTKYIIQRINTAIFKNPDELMENIENVTAFIKEKIVANGGDPLRETLTVVKTTDGKNYYRYADGNAYRVYRFIDETKTV